MHGSEDLRSEADEIVAGLYRQAGQQLRLGFIR
jgi:hypothetical protein